MFHQTLKSSWPWNPLVKVPHHKVTYLTESMSAVRETGLQAMPLWSMTIKEMEGGCVWGVISIVWRWIPATHQVPIFFFFQGTKEREGEGGRIVKYFSSSLFDRQPISHWDGGCSSWMNGARWNQPLGICCIFSHFFYFYFYILGCKRMRVQGQMTRVDGGEDEHFHLRPPVDVSKRFSIH